MEFWHAVFSHRNLYYNLGLVYSFTHLEYILVCFLNFWKTKGAVSNPFFCVKLLCNCVKSSYFLLKVLSVHAIINMCMMLSLLIIAFTDILITQIHYNSGSQNLPFSWHSDICRCANLKANIGFRTCLQNCCLHHDS